MIKGPKLTHPQWKLLASGLSNIGQAVILFSLAAIFVPEVVSLSGIFSRFVAIGYLSCGLFILIVAVILSRRGG